MASAIHPTPAERRVENGKAFPRGHTNKDIDMLQVQQLHQYYGGSHILRGLSFEAKVGEVTCLLGRNGVGKTTLLKCLMGLIPAKESRSPASSRTSACTPASPTCRRGARSSAA